MTYTLIMNWGWFKHQDCRNAYSIHSSDCRIAQNAEKNFTQNKIQGYEADIATLEDAKAEAMADASCRFTDTLKEYGFKQMLKICKCTKEIA